MASSTRTKRRSTARRGGAGGGKRPPSGGGGRSGRASARRPPVRGRKRRRRRRGVGRASKGVLLLAIGCALAIGYGISKVDFGETIAEITLPLRYEEIIRQQADDKNVDASLIAAVIYAESRFQDQTSHAGARGLMQITPDTGDTIETLSGGETFEYEDLSDPDLNIRYGSFYLGHLLDVYGGNEVAALAAYNAGSGNVDKWGGGGLDPGDIEFPETRAYVEEVLDKREQYRDTHGDALGF